jgi:predicted Na+-dependent transporter
MNLKRIFGALLTVLGIVGLIYAAYLFVNTRTDTRNIKSLVTYGIIGILFFVSGIGLIKTTKDES